MRTLHSHLTVILLMFLVVACSSALAVVDSNQNPISDYALPDSSDPFDTKILYLSSISNVLIPSIDDEFENEMDPAVYNAFLCIWADAEHLYEVATKFEQGEMNDLYRYNALLMLATLVRRMELERQNVEVPTNLAQLWEEAKEVHRITKDVIIRWGYKEINATQVVQEMEPELLTIRQVIAGIEKILINNLHFSPSQLIEERERLLELYSRIYVPVPITSHED